MLTRGDLHRQAKESRARAVKARRIAASWAITNPDDVAALVAYAAEMEQKAQDLEAEAVAQALTLPLQDAPVVTHSQQQVQQQSGAQGPAPEAAAKRPADGKGSR
jgi:hypothetical protein